MKMVILGAGALGSMIGGHLALAGAEVRVIARGQRAAFIRTSPAQPPTLSWVESAQAPMAWRPWAGVMGGGSEAS
jgi:ketopantoate reductase